MGKASRGKTLSKTVARPAMAAATTTVAETRVVAHSGPLPSPDVLAGYDRLLPGAAERILQMAEREQNARITLDQTQLEADIEHRAQMTAMQKRVHTGSFISDYLGQFFGFVIALCCLAGAGYSGIIQGNWIVAAVFLSLPAVGMIQAIRGMKSRQKES